MDNIIQLKITLKETKPPVWRRILVHKDTTFFELHHIIQITMGWFNYHLFEFDINRNKIGEPNKEFDFFDGVDVIESSTVTLDSMIKSLKQNFSYEYDFGDGWQHQISVEKFLPIDSSINYPICLKGKLSCPPEDCGGIGGYYQMLNVLDDKNHPEHEEMIEWLGGEYDSEYFDKDEANDELAVLEDYIKEWQDETFG